MRIVIWRCHPEQKNFIWFLFPLALCADVVREVWPEGLFGRTKIWRVTIGARPRKKEKKSKVIFKKQSCRLADTVNTGWNTKPPQKIWAVFSARQVVSINTIRCVTCRLLLRFSHRHTQKKRMRLYLQKLPPTQQQLSLFLWRLARKIKLHFLVFWRKIVECVMD